MNVEGVCFECQCLWATRVCDVLRAGLAAIGANGTAGLLSLLPHTRSWLVRWAPLHGNAATAYIVLQQQLVLLLMQWPCWQERSHVTDDVLCGVGCQRHEWH